MIIPTIINGSWYIVNLSQQEKDKSNAILVLDWDRGLFCDYNGKFIPELQKSLEELPEIFSIGKVENKSFLFEKPVEYWIPLQYRKIIRRDEETFEGVGNLSISKYNDSDKRLITPTLAEELLKADISKPYYLPSPLYVIRYRDSQDIITNPFYQTAIIAKNEEDLRQFRQNQFPNWFNHEFQTLKEMFAEPPLHLLEGIVVMPKVISNFQKNK